MENQNFSLNKIIDGLKSPDIDIRKKCLIILARVNKPSIINIIKPLMYDENDEIRKLTYEIINILTRKFNQNNTINSNIDKEIYMNKFDYTEDLSKIKNLLSSTNYKERIVAFEMAQSINTPDMLNLIKSHLTEEYNQHVIAAAVKTIGIIGSKDDAEYLTDFLSHIDPRVKANTLEALILLGPNISIIEKLFLLINDIDERVKITLAELLSKFDTDLLVDKMNELAKSLDDEIKPNLVKLSFLLDVEATMKFVIKSFLFFNENLKNTILDHLHTIDDEPAQKFIKGYNHYVKNNETIDFKDYSDDVVYIFKLEKKFKNIKNSFETINDSKIENDIAFIPNFNEIKSPDNLTSNSDQTIINHNSYIDSLSLDISQSVPLISPTIRAKSKIIYTILILLLFSFLIIFSYYYISDLPIGKIGESLDATYFIKEPNGKYDSKVYVSAKIRVARVDVEAHKGYSYINIHLKYMSTCKTETKFDYDNAAIIDEEGTIIIGTQRRDNDDYKFNNKPWFIKSMPGIPDEGYVCFKVSQVSYKCKLYFGIISSINNKIVQNKILIFDPEFSRFNFRPYSYYSFTAARWNNF